MIFTTDHAVDIPAAERRDLIRLLEECREQADEVETCLRIDRWIEKLTPPEERNET